MGGETCCSNIMCVALIVHEMVNMHVVMCQKKRSHKKVC